MVFDPDYKDRQTSTQVVNLRHDTYDIYIGRPGRHQDGYFGNGHVIGWCDICEVSHSRIEAIEAFKKDFLFRIEHDTQFRNRVMGMRGKTLGCFCKPLPCHGDIYKEFLDNLPND